MGNGPQSSLLREPKDGYKNTPLFGLDEAASKLSKAPGSIADTPQAMLSPKN